MPSDAFIAAASAANRQPVVCLAIESPDAKKVYCSTKPNWLDSALTNINATSVDGEVRLATDDVEDVPGFNTSPVTASGERSPDTVWVENLPDGYARYSAETAVFCSRARATGIVVNVSDTSNAIVRTWYLYGRKDSGAWQLLQTRVISGSTPGRTLWSGSLARGAWEFKLKIDRISNGILPNIWIQADSYEVTHETLYLATGSLITPDLLLDLGSVPSIASRFEVDDIKNTGCTIAYTAWGKDSAGDGWTLLGSVTDGDTMAPHRYYQIKADLTGSGDGYRSPVITEIRVIGGDSQYVYISTHKDLPIQGALPYIVPGGISSISSKIDLMQQATVGELTAKLYWRPAVGDLIAGDWIKNKTIICKQGYVGLSEVDYEPYFVGTWYDYQSDHEKGIITVKTRNILKRFNKKIPDAEHFLIKERFHIAFASNSSGVGFSHSPTGATYIGVYVDFSDTDSTDPAAYVWSAVNNTNGATVAADKNGATRYLHIAFATNATGSTGFDSTTVTGKTYVGYYVDTTLADGTDPALYKWVLIDAQTNLLTAIYSKPNIPIEKKYAGNVMQTMLDIADALGIPDRLIKRASFTDLAAGARAGDTVGTDWYVERTVTEQQDAMEMLNELSVSAGVFLFEGADGRLTAKLYDDFAADSVPAAETLDAVHCKFKPVDGGQKDLKTRQAIYYDLIPGKEGGSPNDYSNCYFPINVVAEADWEETNTLEWFDKWMISPKAVQMLGQRRDHWFSRPWSTVRVDDVPPRFCGIERGQIVAVDNLQMVCPEEQWQGFTNGTRFLVLGKSSSDPTSANQTLSFDLMQLEAPTFTIDPNFPNYSRLDFWPAVTALAATERFDNSNGVVNGYLDVQFTEPAGYVAGSAVVWTRTTSGGVTGEWISHTTVPFGLGDAIKRLSVPTNPGDEVEIAVSTRRPDNQQMPLDQAPVITKTVSVPPRDPSGLLAILEDSLTAAQLAATLKSRIDLIDADNVGLVSVLDRLGTALATLTAADADRWERLLYERQVTDATVEIAPVAYCTLSGHGDEASCVAAGGVWKPAGTIRLKATADITSDIDASLRTLQGLYDAINGTITTLNGLTAAHSDAIASYLTDSNSTVVQLATGLSEKASSSYVDLKTDAIATAVDVATFAVEHDIPTALAYMVLHADDAARKLRSATANIATHAQEIASTAAALEAESHFRTELDAKVDANRSELLSNYYTKSVIDAAAAGWIAQAVASSNGNTATVLTNYYTKSDINSASAGWIDQAVSDAAAATAAALNNYSTTAEMGEAITTASSTIRAALNATFHQTTAPTVRADGSPLKSGDAWYDTTLNSAEEKKNDLYLYDGRTPYNVAGWIASPNGQTTANGAAIAVEQQVRATVLAPDYAPDGTYPAKKCVIHSGQLYRNTSGATISNGGAWTGTGWTAITSDLYAQYGVRLDVNGYVVGIGLSNDGSTGEFAIVADKFLFAPVATDPAALDGSPFFVLTSPTEVNGVVLPPGAYIKTAFIANLTSDNIKAGGVTADSLSVTELSAIASSLGTVTAGSIDIPDTNTAIEFFNLGFNNNTTGFYSTCLDGRHVARVRQSVEQNPDVVAKDGYWTQLTPEGVQWFRSKKTYAQLVATTITAKYKGLLIRPSDTDDLLYVAPSGVWKKLSMVNA